MNRCHSCGNVAPSGCSQNLCADHCTGCSVHKTIATKNTEIEHSTARLRAKMKIKEDRKGIEDEDTLLEQALQMSLNEAEMIDRAIKTSLLEAETSFRSKVEMIKMVLPDIAEEKISQALNECKGDQTAAIEKLLLLDTSTESKSPTSSPRTPTSTVTTTSLSVTTSTTATTTSTSGSSQSDALLATVDTDLEEVQRAMESIDRELKNKIYENDALFAWRKYHFFVLRVNAANFAKVALGR